MFKVIEKKFFILLIVVVSMVVVPFLAEAGGMGGMSSKHGSTTYVVSGSNYANYYSPTRANSLLYPSTYTSPYYNYGSLYSGGLNGYNYGTPYTYGLNGYTYGSPYTYSGLNALNFGQQQVVTGKEYTQEQSFTQYVPGGEVTTTLGETTETAVIPSYGSLLSPYNYNYGLGTGYLGNAYNYGYGYNYPYNSWLY